MAKIQSIPHLIPQSNSRLGKMLQICPCQRLSGDALTTFHIIAEPVPQFAHRISLPICCSRRKP